MKTFSFLSLALFTSCAAQPPDDGDAPPFETQSHPNPDGKSDTIRACGDASCEARLCGYDCTVAGQQCTQACAPTPASDKAFVRATIAGSTGSSTTIDSRETPYVPVFSLDNVLVYGCELWDFSNQVKDGLEIELQQLRHSSFTVNPNDPTRYDHKLMVYVAPFLGPGSYRGQAGYAANEHSTTYFSTDGCAVDVTADTGGALHGTFSCQIPAAGTTSSVRITGEFGCPIDAMAPQFVRWTPAL